MVKDKIISLRLTAEEVDRLQSLADKAGISRNKLIHNMVVTGIETLEDLDSVGVVNAVLAVRNIENFFKSRKKIGKEQET